MNLKFYRLITNAKLPVRAHRTDAGMDLFYCPNGNRGVCTEDNGDYWIPARGSSLVSTGLKTEIPEGYMLEVKNKSGIASKRQLVVGACVVDPGYDGEIYVNLHNIGVETQVIKPGDKIAQAVLVPIVHCGIEETTEDNLNNGFLVATGASAQLVTANGQTIQEGRQKKASPSKEGRTGETRS